MSIVAVPVPPGLVAVTVYVVDDITTVGVPLNSPVEESSDKPAGSVGETDQVTTGSPLAVGVTAVIAEPFVNMKLFGEYVTDEGGASLTSIVNVALALPPELVAVTV